MQFLRVFQHLLPTGQAWRTTIDKHLRRFFEGLSAEPARVVEYFDQIYEDYFPDTTRELEQWEAEYGLEPSGSEAARRLRLAGEWRATGGQSPRYVQDVLQTAGFNVYVHDWWSSGPPYVARNVLAYTERPIIGTVQASSFAADQPQASSFFDQPQADAFLANDPHYIVNRDLTPRAPPPIPIPVVLAGFMYVGGQTFGDIAIVPASRRDEFLRLLMKLRPLHLWVVTLVQYGGVFSAEFSSEFS